MRILLITLLLIKLPLLVEAKVPNARKLDRTPPSSKGLNNPLMPDIPDPYALHTKKGKLFEQPAMNGDDIAIMYYQLTGKRVLPSQAASTVEIKIVQPGPLTNHDVVQLIESKLMMEGYSLVSVPGNDRQLRLLPVTGGNANVKNTGTRIITNKSDLPSNDEVITYAMRMNHIKPEEAATIFQSVIGQFGPAGTVVPVANASSILITDNALLIRSIIDLKEQIDVPATSANTKFIELIYADAEQIAEQLNELVNNEETSGNVRTSPSNSRTQSNQPSSGDQGGNPGVDIPLKVIAESRTNRIVLLGSSDKIIFAETLIKQLDKPSSDKKSIRRKLKYLPVTEFMPIAANAIEATLGSNSSGGQTNSNRSNRNQPSNNNSATTRNNNTTNGTTGTTGTTGGNRATLGGQDGSTAPDSMLIGKTLLVSDNISNSIVVNGPPHHIEIVQNLLDELDKRSEQIAITAVFGKYGNADDRSFGSDVASLFSNNPDNGPQIGGGGMTNNGPTSISTIFSSDTLAAFASAALGSGLSFGFANDDLGIFLNATKSRTNFQEFSRPTIFTTNNRSARISSGSRIAVPTGSYNGGGNFGTSTQIEYRDVALELEVRPLVNGYDEVTLQIAIVKDSLGQNRIISTGGAELNTQDIDSEELSTIVTVPDRSLIILGGLYTDGVADSDSRVPILGDIPILGRLFRTNSTDEDLSELVIMVYPRIVKNRSDLFDYQKEYNDRSYITPKTRENFNSNSLLEEAAEQPKKKKSWWNKYQNTTHHNPLYDNTRSK